MIILHTSKDNQHYFTVTSRNHKPIVTSETYRSKSSMKKGYKALMKAMLTVGKLTILDKSVK